jgi:hypothetical protein
MKTPYEKFLARYSNLPFEQADAEAEFVERRTLREVQLRTLESETRTGAINGFRELAFLATEATRIINDWARKHPEYVAVVAEQQPFWPTLVTNTSARDPKVKALLHAIKLDAGHPLVAHGDRVGLDPVPAKKWASALLGCVEAARKVQGASSVYKTAWGLRSLHGERLTPLFSLPKQARKDILKHAKSLEPFSEGTCDSWWWLAKRIFLLITDNRPHDIPELKQYAPEGTSKRNEVIEEVRKSFYRLTRFL